MRTQRAPVETRKYIMFLTEAFQEIRNKETAAALNARLIMDLVRLNDKGVNNGLSSSETCARICQAVKKLADLPHKTRTNDIRHLLFDLTKFLDNPPPNWSEQLADLYKNKTIAQMLANFSAENNDGRERTKYRWLQGDMALAAGDKKEARSYFEEAKRESANVGKSLRDIGTDVALVRDSLERRLRRATSP